MTRAHPVGLHLNNKVDKAGPEFLARARHLNVNGIGFLTEIKPENVEEILQVNPNGVYMVRPYLAPRDASRGEYLNAAQLQGYIDQFAEWMRLTIAASPTFRSLLARKKIVAAPFNEPNIPVGGRGAEGFPLGEEGMRLLNWAWNDFYDRIKPLFPDLQIGSTPMTPGNYDIYFLDPDHRTDPQNSPTWNKHHWYHGPEASRGDPTTNHPLNPTAAQITAARNSCINKRMFERCDVVFVHVYPEYEGDENKLWAGLRHKQIAKFVPTNKPWIIKECDVGTQVKPGGVRDQHYRAQHFPEWTRIVEEQTPYVVAYFIWLDGTNHDETWSMNKLADEGGRGVWRPTMNTLHDYTQGRDRNPIMSGATPPVEPPPTVPPPPPANPETEWVGFTPTVRAAMTYTPATVAVGGQYWLLKRIEFVDFPASGGLHAMFFDAPQNTGDAARIKNQNGGINERLVFNEAKAKDFPMWAGNIYTVNMEGLPSDTIAGMRMFQNQHVVFRFVWEKRTKAGAPPPPPPAPTWTKADAAKAVWFNESFARFKRGDVGAKEALLAALQAEPVAPGVHNVIVAVALPPLKAERDK